MINIGYSSSFLKSYKKLIKSSPEIENKFLEKVDIFIHNPNDNRLKTHKLSGELKNLWSFSLDFDMRIIFYLESNEIVTFLNIGSHNIVY
jgi:addiction module RelE/StbE family toxin